METTHNTIEVPFDTYADRVEDVEGYRYVTLTCPACGQADVDVPADLNGENAPCPNCGTYTEFDGIPDWDAIYAADRYDAETRDFWAGN